MSPRNVWAVSPVKETNSAKQRLSAVFSKRFRQRLALTMFEDTIRAASAVSEIDGIIVVTIDPAAAKIATLYGAEVWSEGARDGHTGAVTAVAHRLSASGATMLTMPGDIPLVSAKDIRCVLEMHAAGRAFTIVPARDKQGSNAIACTPAKAVPLRFGANSYFPHLAAAREQSINPRSVEIPTIALDIDEPADVEEFMRIRSETLSRRLLDSVEVTLEPTGGQF